MAETRSAFSDFCAVIDTTTIHSRYIALLSLNIFFYTCKFSVTKHIIPLRFIFCNRSGKSYICKYRAFYVGNFLINSVARLERSFGLQDEHVRT